jgi:MoaD family protein
MRVKIRFFSVIRDIVNSNEIVLEYSSNSISVKNLIDELLLKFPKLKPLFSEFNPVILVNGIIANGEEIIKDGDEVAIVPPLSGGSKHIYASLFRNEDIDVAQRINELTSRYGVEGSGAIVIFIGIVKGYVEGHRVYELIYDAYEPYTSKSLEKIAFEEAMNNNIDAIEIMHRVGSAKPGEKTLYIAVVAKKRKEAIETLSKVLERVKHEVPIFKLEKRDDGEYWIIGESKRIKRNS